MNWLFNLIKNKPFVSLLPAAGMGAISFLGQLFLAISDGQLDGNEIHQLLSGANGVEIGILIVVMIALRKKNDKL